MVRSLPLYPLPTGLIHDPPDPCLSKGLRSTGLEKDRNKNMGLRNFMTQNLLSITGSKNPSSNLRSLSLKRTPLNRSGERQKKYI
jgi:hypothetical protein